MKKDKQGANLHENYCVQNSTKSMEKFKLPTGILKVNMDNENAVGLGLKKHWNRTNRGQNLHEK